MNQISKNLWGLVLIVVGVILGLNALNITQINLLFDGWWTLLVIIPCFINLFNKQEEKTGNIIGICIGIALLLSSQGIIQFEIILKLIVPFILIAIGLSFILSDTLKGKVKEKIKSIDQNNSENIIAIFAEQKVNKDRNSFKSANLDAVFGGITLDLRGADLENEIIIKASAIFGGIDILLPEDVIVKVKSTPIFGGVSNKIRNQKSSTKTIYIDAFCLFGGVDIK